MAVISFARGVPSPDLLPVAEIASAAQRALEQDPAGALAYGDGAGYAPLRQWIATRYGDGDAGRVLCTNGSLQGLAFLAETMFAGSGGRAIVEAPTYDRAILILRRFGATVESVDLHTDGLDVDAIEAACDAGRVPGLVYTIPNFQNPGGMTLSRAKRERLVALARTHGFLVLEDDPYGELRFDGTDEPRHVRRSTRARATSSTRRRSRRPWRRASAPVRWCCRPRCTRRCASSRSTRTSARRCCRSRSSRSTARPGTSSPAWPA